MRSSPARLRVFSLYLTVASVAVSASAQRLDPGLLLRWKTEPIVAPRAGLSRAFDVVASERLELMRDGRLRYERRDARDAVRVRRGLTTVSSDTVRDVTAALRRLCALGLPASGTSRPGDVYVEVQFDDYRGCALRLPPARWRAGSTRSFAETVDDLIRRAVSASSRRGAVATPPAAR